MFVHPNLDRSRCISADLHQVVRADVSDRVRARVVHRSLSTEKAPWELFDRAAHAQSAPARHVGHDPRWSAVVILARTWDQVRAARRPNNKATFQGLVTDFIVPEPGDRPRPQAFLVEQNPNWILPTHFHLQHQFQVVTAGAGTLGRRSVETLSIHYASPQSGYGPLTAGPEGISYLTLRVVSDEGAWYLPNSRERMQRGLKKHQEHASPKTLVSDVAIRELHAPTVDVLIAPRENGLAAYLVRMPPDQVIPAPACDRNGGRFYVVTKGSLVVGDTNLPGLTTVFVSPDEILDIRSGPAGIEALVTQFPEAARGVER